MRSVVTLCRRQDRPFAQVNHLAMHVVAGYELPRLIGRFVRLIEYAIQPASLFLGLDWSPHVCAFIEQRNIDV